MIVSIVATVGVWVEVEKDAVIRDQQNQKIPFGVAKTEPQLKQTNVLQISGSKGNHAEPEIRQIFNA